MFKRVMIKLSGEALAGSNSTGIDDNTVSRIVDDIITAINNGTEVTLVVGGGNFWRGRSADSNMDRTKADQIGMLATTMNAIHLADMFRQKGVEAKVMTPFPLANITTYFTKDESLDIMKRGGVTINAGGLGHPYFSTDTITALRAIELECDCIMYAKSVDGVYNDDPAKNPNAVKYKELTYRQILQDNLKAIDLTAMNLCEENNMTSLVFALEAENSIVSACKNDENIYKIATKITN